MAAVPQAPRQSNDEALAQLRYLQNVYSQQYQLLEDQIATYSLSLDEIRKGVAFLNDVKSAHKANTLVNIGGGAYVQASFGQLEKAMVYVGAGYLVERSAEETKLFIEEMVKKQETALRRLDADRRKLQNELISLSYKMESMQPQ